MISGKNRKERRTVVSEAERPKRKSRTSNAVKKRYNDKTYSKYSFLVPKNGGLDIYIKTARESGASIGELVRRALIEYLAKHKAP
jgi:hypothetical protein